MSFRPPIEHEPTIFSGPLSPRPGWVNWSGPLMMIDPGEGQEGLEGLQSFGLYLHFDPCFFGPPIEHEPAIFSGTLSPRPGWVAAGGASS